MLTIKGVDLSLGTCSLFLTFCHTVAAALAIGPSCWALLSDVCPFPQCIREHNGYHNIMNSLHNVYIYMHVYNVHANTRVHTCIYMYMQTHVYTHASTCTCKHTYMYIVYTHNGNGSAGAGVITSAGYVN